MAYNQIPRGGQKPFEFAGNYKDVEHSASIRPAGQFLAAPWLPVKIYDEWRREGLLMAPGTAVKLDISGHLIPAGMLDKLNAPLDPIGVITYTALDVGVTINVNTGLYVTAADAVTGDFDIPVGQIPPESKCIGVVSHAVYSHQGVISSTASGAAFLYNINFQIPHQTTAGVGVNADGIGANTEFRLQNYSGTDNLVTVLCDYVIRVPLVPVNTTDPVPANITLLGSGTVLSELAKTIVHVNDNGADAVVPGGYVVADSRGNFVGWDLVDFSDVVGQIIWIKDYRDQASLSKVRSPGLGNAGFGATQGNATHGVDKSTWLCTDGAVASGTVLAGGLVQSDLSKLVGINLLK